MILKISASAGSGKTYTLTRRFLGMLEHALPHARAQGCALHEDERGYTLAEILAATFTNKAAAEMKNRVLGRLKECALDREEKGAAGEGSGFPSAAQAAMWVERILRHYGSLNIRTIDSLLAALVRLSALELGLAPDFQPSFATAEYFTPLYDALMEDIKAGRETGAPSPTFCHADAATLRAAVEQSCATLLHFGEFRGFSPGLRLHNLVLELVNRLLQGGEVPDMDSGEIHARLNIQHTALTRSAEKLLRLLGEEGLSVNANYLKYLAKCCALPRMQAPSESVYADKDSLDDCLNKASKGSAPEPVLAAFDEFGQTLRGYSQSLPLFRHALQLAPLALVAREIYSRMQAGWREKALLPALRLPHLAEMALSGQYGVSDALCRMGTRLSRLMLDEFQDTSREQWGAIQPLAVECLSRGGGLIYVGDVKQAIYGWRGGDARLFTDVPHDPELRAIAESVDEETLPCNWRSCPAIVRHNNAFFGLLSRPEIALECLTAMLPPKTPAVWAGRAAEDAASYYSDVRQAVPAAKNWDADPALAKAGVRLYLTQGEKVGDVVELVRRRLRPLLREELLAVWKPGDIALLVLSNEEAGRLAEWLTDWGIPVVTENSFLLAAHPLVNRLVSFLSFLDYPLDDLAFWEFISGPECLAAAIMREACPDNGRPWPLPGKDWPARKNLQFGKKRPPLYQLFRQEFPEIWQGWIAPFFSEAGLMSAYDTLKEIIRRYGLDDGTPARSPFLQRFLEVAHLAETRGYSSLAAFLAFWKECGESEKLPLPENMDAVRIMTMHKAKGLEFPVVVLPFQHKALRRDPELIAVERQGLRILTRADKHLEEVYYPAAIMNELERLNLLYVSWTRPVYALHAFITRPKTSTALSRALDVLLGHYREEVSPEEYEWEDIGAENADQALHEEEDKTAAGDGGQDAFGLPAGTEPAGAEIRADTVPFPDCWRPMDWLPRLRIYRSSLESAVLTPKRRGVLAHLCLEHLTLSAPSAIESPEGEAARGAGTGHFPQTDPGPTAPETPGAQAIRQDVRRAVSQGMRLFPMPLENPEQVAREMEACLFWFASLPEAPLWLARGRREQGIADVAGNMHRVDLLVDVPAGTDEDAAGFLHAIDYKTGQYPDASVAREHRGQVLRYMRLLGAAKTRPVRGSLIYLDARRVEAIS